MSKNLLWLLIKKHGITPKEKNAKRNLSILQTLRNFEK
jgi:hypothetical protein